MATVCSVKFPFVARDLWFDAFDFEIQRGDAVICSTARGTERGIATGAPQEWDDERLDRELGGEALAPILRLSTPEDDAVADERDEQGRNAFPIFQEAVLAHELPMKPVGVEYLFGLERVVCYFMSEGRVDFRSLARDLSQRLDQRVDMHQLGAREQSAIMGGIAHCGQEFCCTRLGQGFGTVTIRMAKDQDLPLSSPKISGACGRLMCCLRYENDVYRDFKSRAPKKNARVQTPMGEARVVELDTPREAVTLRLENDKSLKVPIACMETSEGAREQAERNHAVCRPDCVTRAALEALDSAQVRLALAQLEAEEELENEEYLAPEDMLLDEGEQKARRRRRPASEGDASSEGPGVKRRHRRAGQAPSAQSEKGAEEKDAGDEAASGKNRRSRRRTRRSRGKAAEKAQVAAEAPKADEPAATEAPKKRSRRRRRKPSGEKAQAQANTQAHKDAPQDGAKDGQPKRPRRRRGRGKPKPQDGAQPRSEGPHPATPEASAKPQSGEGDKRPGRARRRHRRRPAATGQASEG